MPSAPRCSQVQDQARQQQLSDEKLILDDMRSELQRSIARQQRRTDAPSLSPPDASYLPASALSPPPLGILPATQVLRPLHAHRVSTHLPRVLGCMMHGAGIMMSAQAWGTNDRAVVTSSGINSRSATRRRRKRRGDAQEQRLRRASQ